MKRIKKIIQLFPILAVTLVFIASLKNYIYFNHFGINIFDFWKFDEIITSFLDEIVLIGIMLFGGFMSLISNTLWNSFKTYNENNKNSHEQKETEIDFEKQHKKIRIFLIVFLILAVIFNAYSYFSRKITFHGASINLMVFLFIFIFVYFIIELRRKSKTWDNVIQYYPVLILYILFIVAISMASYDVNEVKYKAKYNGTIIEFNSSKNIVSNITNYYIGKTNDFIFVYDELKESCSVYLMKDLKKMVLIKQSSKDNLTSQKGYYKNFKQFREELRNLTD